GSDTGPQSRRAARSRSTQVRRRVSRQPQTDDGAAPRLAFNLDDTTMLLDNLPGDRQPQPTAGRLGVDVGAAVKALEDTWHILGRDAAALVAHSDQRTVGCILAHDRHRHLNLRAVRTVLQRIVE